MAMKPKKISKTRQQTHRFLYYDLSHTGTTEDFHYIDIARTMSSLNRRLYRQGMVYHVANITVHDSNGNAEVRFATAPNTWTTHLAWKNAFEGWKKQRAEVLSETQLTPGKWSDFKVYLNQDMVDDADWPVAINVENQTTREGAWDYSNMTFSKSGVQYDDHALGLLGPSDIGTAITNETSPDDTSYDGYLGAIEVLEDSRRRINTPEVSPATDVVLFGTVNAGTTNDTIEEIIDEGDDSPYPLHRIVGGGSNPSAGSDAFTVRECHIASTYSPIAHVGGFPVPCGLIQVETKSSTDGNIIGLLIELVPGDYKGVHALPMGA